MKLGDNARNRLATLEGAVGTTVFGNAPGGLLANDNGPSSSDTVTVDYSFRLRSLLTL